jgi:quercetin dioxygenase-like cupin family protein
MIRVDKPWGHEEIWAHTSKYVGKNLYIKAGHRLSRQYHVKKEETIRVVSGNLHLEVGLGTALAFQNLSPGEVFHVSPGTVHRFCALDHDVVLVEVSTPEINDVVRLQDDYDR